MWATISFAIGMFAGAVGPLLLLQRNPYAFDTFILFLIGVVLTRLYTISSGIPFSPGEVLAIVASPVVVASFLVWYARFAERKEWLTARSAAP